MIISYKQFAATYGQGTYGGGQFSTGTSTSTTSDNGVLPSTGTNIVLGLVGGVLLIVIAIALFVGSRRKRRK